ncbi:uncharacterized protein TNCV_1628921 [Trichonephila clavipes]|nr:uncharacterized protein TNCV_1628921 [Trichonephila clavipes]
MLKDKVGMSIGCLMLIIVEEKKRNSEVVRRPSNGRNDCRGDYENGSQGNQWFDSKNRFQKDDRRFKDRGYQFRNGGQKDDFREGTAEIEVRVRILIEMIEDKGDD